MATCKDVEKALAKEGLLLMQDKTAASVVGIITGEKLSGSWWSHPKGKAIFACVERLREHADVIESRLIAGKITFIHRRLWPEFLALAQSGEAWQKRGLSKNAKPQELQERLLVHAEQVHTESGKHELRLQPWRSDIVPSADLAAARATIEAAVTRIGAKVASLPWHRFA
jgi:hypothetical protein